MVFGQLHYITNRGEIFVFKEKKCCIYTAYGVSQTSKITDNGKEYRVGFMIYQICKSNPDFVGVDFIVIADKTNKKV